MADANDFLKGHNSVGDIDYLVYSEMYDYLMPLFDKAYECGKKVANANNK